MRAQVIQNVMTSQYYNSNMHFVQLGLWKSCMYAHITWFEVDTVLT